jgi:hypothetical protein
VASAKRLVSRNDGVIWGGRSVDPNWLGVPMFVSGFEADESRDLVRFAGLRIVRDDMPGHKEPGHGDVEFLRMLAQRQAR